MKTSLFLFTLLLTVASLHAQNHDFDSQGIIYKNSNNGNLGIGTELPPDDYLLAVHGKVIAEEIKVQMQYDWPDYVFNKDYNLISLKSLQKYIDENGHLPGIPSQAEVQEEQGIELGKLNQLLLQKIEELTLYMLKAEKKIIALEQKISLLEHNNNK